MTEHERKIKKRVQLIVSLSMVFFFSLCIISGVLLAVKANQDKHLKSLRATNTELKQQFDDEGDVKDYLISQRFIDEYALRKLGYGRDGTKIFK